MLASILAGLFESKSHSEYETGKTQLLTKSVPGSPSGLNTGNRIEGALGSDNAKSTINTARRRRLTEEFAPFLTIYYYLSQFIDCPCCDSSIVATVVQCWQLKSPPTDRLSLAAFVVDLALSD